jgi:hypothetical protein
MSKSPQIDPTGSENEQNRRQAGKKLAASSVLVSRGWNHRHSSQSDKRPHKTAPDKSFDSTEREQHHSL